ncbi:MAG: hypothetical protein AAFO62_03760 [Pseudomonadota bacterium]
MVRLVGAAIAIVALPVAAHAAALSAEYCRDLDRERKALTAAGVADHIERGPEWAKANLTPKQIGSIGAYIALEEQLKFQCPIGFDNVVVAQIKGDARSQPPIPSALDATVRQAKVAALTTRTQRRSSRGEVPLPVRNALRGRGAVAPAGQIRGTLSERPATARPIIARERPRPVRPALPQQTAPRPGSSPSSATPTRTRTETWADDVFNAR